MYKDNKKNIQLSVFLIKEFIFELKKILDFK